MKKLTSIASIVEYRKYKRGFYPFSTLGAHPVRPRVWIVVDKRNP